MRRAFFPSFHEVCQRTWAEVRTDRLLFGLFGLTFLIIALVMWLTCPAYEPTRSLNLFLIMAVLLLGLALGLASWRQHRLIRILRRQADEFIYGLKEFKDGKYVLYYSLSREDLKTEREMMFPCLRDLVDQELDRRELLEIRRRASDPAPRHLQEVR